MAMKPMSTIWLRVRRRAFELRGNNSGVAAVEFAMIGQYPNFKTIVSEPRFLTVMRQVGLPR